MERLTIKNSAGQNIAAVFHPAQEPKGLAILCPGYLDTKDYAHLVSLAETLTGAGYDAVRFDPTGTWESEGEITDYTPTQYLDDIKSIIDAMVARKEYPKVILCGHSMGGTISARYAATDPRVAFTAIVMSGAVYRSTAKWQATGVRSSTRDLPFGRSGVKEFHVPYSYKEDLDRYDSLAAVAKPMIPKLFLAGQKDDTIEPDMVRAFFDAANGPKKFFVLPGLSHDYRRDPRGIAAVNEKILEAVKNLG